ncbi:AAA family ATPase [Hathewaya massiliensis]|uniref:AAA family ATPase n=1 Tax=Hathewaya massiliensis TaxID=1964382 RepID=UPI00115C1A92|nr:AAA family ATPase [Hathewaya massiliensis]
MSSLAYIHIKKLEKNDIKIENVSMNFDHIWNFKYNSHKLSIEEKECEQYFTFSQEREIDINALIGENGAGKSTILNLIKQLFFGNTLIDYQNSIEDEIVIVIKDKTDCYNVFAPQNPLNPPPSGIEIKYIDKVYVNSEKWFKNNDKVGLNDTDFVYFSNIFSHESDDLLRWTASEYNERLHDISIANYLKKDSEKSVQTFYNVDSRFYKLYEVMNITRIFEFLIDDKNKSFIEKILNKDFNKTNIKLFVTPIYDAFKVKESLKPYGVYITVKAKKLIDKVNNIHNQCKKDGCFPKNDLFIINIFNNSLYAILRSINKYKGKFFEKNQGWKNNINIESEEQEKMLNLAYEYYGDEMNYQLKECYSNINIKIGDSKDFSHIMKRFFYNFIEKLQEKLTDSEEEKQLKEIFESIYKVFSGLIELGENSGYLYMDSTGIDVNVIANKDKLQELFSNYITVEEMQRFIILKLGFSSGEEALLNIFSRFYELEKNKIKKEDLIILLDEPELYLHPEWQRKLIFMLIKYFENKEIYKNKNIQVILTSNTPYVISDIPRDKIHYICSKKCNHYNIINNTVGIKIEQTFAANIHALLTNSFFMSNTVGEFAKNKISTVIKELENLRINIKKCVNQKLEIVIDKETCAINEEFYSQLKKKKFKCESKVEVCNYYENLKKLLDKVDNEYSFFIDIIGERIVRKVVKDLLDDILYTSDNLRIYQRKSIEDKIKYHKDMLKELERKKEGNSL